MRPLLKNRFVITFRRRRTPYARLHGDINRSNGTPRFASRRELGSRREQTSKEDFGSVLECYGCAWHKFWLPDAEANHRYALPLGLLEPNNGAPPALQFRSFLGRTEPGFVAWRPEGDWYLGKPVPPFGLCGPDVSLAVWIMGYIVAQSGRVAASRLADAYARWAELGLPGAGTFRLEVCRSADAPAASATKWLDKRGETALIWQLKPMDRSWHELRAARPTIIR